MSFGRKLVLVMILVAVVPVTLLGIISLTFAEREVTQRVDEAQRTTAQLTASAVDRFFRDVVRSLKHTIDMIPFEDFPADKLGLALQIPYRQFDYLSIVALLDDKGRPLSQPVHQSVRIQLPGDGERAVANAEDVRQFKKQIPRARALRHGHAFSRAYLNRQTGKPRVVLAMAFKRPAGKRLILAVEVSLIRLNDLLKELTRSGRSCAFLVSDTGRVLLRAGADAPPVGKSGLNLHPVSRGLKTRKAQSGRFELPGPGPMLGSFAPVTSRSWGVVVAEPQAAAYETVGRIRRYTIFWALLCLVIALFAGVWFARGISGPVRELAAAAEQISDGNYEQRLEARSSDEIGQLARTFNNMATSVQKAYETVLDQSKQLRESERRFRTLVETSPDSIVRCDPAGVILQANTQTAKLLNVAAEDLPGTPLIDHVTLIGSGQKSTTDGPPDFVANPTRDLSFNFRAPDGASGLGALSSTPVLGTDGQLGGCVAILRDVTEWRTLQARLAQSDRLASVGMLAAGVAHEINNPLTFVLGNLQLFEEELADRRDATTGKRSVTGGLPPADADPPDDSGEEMLKDALEGAIRIRDIVANLRLFSRVENTEDAPILINEILEGALRMAKHQIRHRAQVITELGDLPEVLANEGKLSQVFLNLLVNAAQAIPEGDAAGNEIRVRTWSEGEMVFGEISDSGEGIESELLDRLFDPFFTTKPQGEGTGLGLAICHGIVSEYGGRIEVVSKPGEGTQFTVILPQLNEEYLVEQAPPATAPETSTQRARLLVVDDEPSVVLVAKRLLAARHDVDTALSGAEAITMIEADDGYDLILCDLLMPQVTGEDLHNWCKEHQPELATRMLFMTGGTFQDRTLGFLKKIDFPLLEKPFNTSVLVRLIAEALQSVERHDKAAGAHAEHPGSEGELT